MSDYVTLLGAEDVARASRSIVGAADSMSRTADGIDESFRMFLRHFEELVERMEAAAEAVQRTTVDPDRDAPGGSLRELAAQRSVVEKK